MISILRTSGGSHSARSLFVPHVLIFLPPNRATFGGVARGAWLRTSSEVVVRRCDSESDRLNTSIPPMIRSSLHTDAAKYGYCGRGSKATGDFSNHSLETPKRPCLRKSRKVQISASATEQRSSSPQMPKSSRNVALPRVTPRKPQTLVCGLMGSRQFPHLFRNSSTILLYRASTGRTRLAFPTHRPAALFLSWDRNSTVPEVLKTVPI